MHMNFSEDSQHSYFFSQPHQPFFILAFINAVVTMFIFLLSYKGVISMTIGPPEFHAYGFSYLLFTPVFFGFLFTTFPRFTSTQPVEQKVYIRIFSLYYIGSILFLLGSIISAFLSGVGMLTILIAHYLGYRVLRKIYKRATVEDTHDVYWIGIAMVMGLVSHGIFIIGKFFFPSMIGFSTEIAVLLYLFFLTFSVAQRMIPFFSHLTVEKNKALLKNLFWLLVIHIYLEGVYTNSSFVIDLAIAYLLGKEILRWELPFPNPNPLLWVLHIALFWVPLSFALAGLSNLVILLTGVNFVALDTHAILLGFVFTVLIGFGTRVTLGHSGNEMVADKLTTLLFVWTQVVVLLRLLTSFVSAFGFDSMILFDITATAWIVMFVAWMGRFALVLIKGKKLTD
jgi:uncharacterized protein involved in response to NO